MQGGNDEQKKDKKKKLNKMIELPLEFKTHGFARPELENYCKQEVSFSVKLYYNLANFDNKFSLCILVKNDK